ncbi:MAG TPA: threonine/serine dehydratase [Sphingomonadales bacterium]|nr:threonine/serine dehydratase [Sphingomonadales bacterium]
MTFVRSLPSFSDVEGAAKRIARHVTRTPLLRSVELDRATGATVLVKADCLQPTGAFKVRGAFSRLTALSAAEKRRGVVAFSSGNHGQAVAYAAKTLGLSAVIVMPKTAPAIKITKTKSHGARVVLYDPKTKSREKIASGIAARTGRILVPSFDDPFIVAGQGTAALEAVEDAKALGLSFDVYLVCTGGAGLLSGTTLVFEKLSPQTKLYAVEPKGYDDFARSLKAGRRLSIGKHPPVSFCDAIRTPSTSDLTFAIASRFAAGGLVVSDAEVKRAMRFAFENLKIVTEPGGTVALAALLAGKIPAKGKTIGLTITGGNVDPEIFVKILKSR